jgi:AhpD family alkylhydroperoxidase
MSSLPAIDPTTAQPSAAAALERAKKAFGGSVPNLTRVMANSPVTLDGYLEFSKALSDGLLGPDVSERIALLVAEENGCGYCLSAHSYVAEHALHLSTDEIAGARGGECRPAHPRGAPAGVGHQQRPGRCSRRRRGGRSRSRRLRQ